MREERAPRAGVCARGFLPMPEPAAVPRRVALAAEEPQHQHHEDDPGVMIAVKVPDDVAKQLDVEGGNKPADMHCTLVYLGFYVVVQVGL